jgi:hypothetical protein
MRCSRYCIGVVLGVVLFLGMADLAAIRARAPAPFGNRNKLRGPRAQWIADLASEDGNKRVAATRNILRLGKDALPALKRAGAKLIVPSQKERPPRLDVVYSLIKGWKDNPPSPREIYKSDRFWLFLARGWTRAEIHALGRRVGFTVCIFDRPGWPDAEVQVDRKLTLAQVMKATLITEPKVVSVNLVPAR